MLVTETFCVAISMTILNRFQPFLDGDGGRNLVQCAITASVESMSVPATCCVQFLSLSAAFTRPVAEKHIPSRSNRIAAYFLSTGAIVVYRVKLCRRG